MRPVEAWAVFSKDRVYRYALGRTWAWGGDPTYVAFIGLNPSTADENIDDPTVRRCIGFAQLWGYGGLVVLNLFAYRSTDPAQLFMVDDPIGCENDHYIKEYAAQSEIVVAAWGNMGKHLNRDMEIRTLLPNLYHLGLTKIGCPRHPLYLPKTIKPEVWR